MAKSKYKPVAIQRHHDRVAERGCLVCGGLAEVHHVTASINGGRISRSETRVVPLCPAHHRHDCGKESVERLSHGGFYDRFGIDLLAEAERLWEETRG